MQNQKGFSLIEMLLYVGITATVLLGASMMFGILTDAGVKNQSINEVEQQGMFVADVIGRSIDNATAVNTPSTGSTGSTLSLQTVDSGTNPTVFDVNSGVLRISEGGGSAVNLTNSLIEVTAFSVENVSHAGTSGSVRVSLTLSRINPSGRNEYDYTKTFYVSGTLRQP